MKPRIIKAPNPHVTPTKRHNPERTRIVRAVEQEAAERARAIIYDAEQHATQVIAEAETAALTLRQEAQEQSSAQAAKWLLTLQQETTAQAQALIESMRAGVTDLSVAIAEKIIGMQLQLSADTVVHIVQQVLRNAGPVSEAVLRVNPADEAVVAAHATELRKAGEIRRLSVQPDESVKRGGCTLETPLGQIDGTLATQLDAIAEALANEG